jgi:hypothetical protein
MRIRERILLALVAALAAMPFFSNEERPSLPSTVQAASRAQSRDVSSTGATTTIAVTERAASTSVLTHYSLLFAATAPATHERLKKLLMARESVATDDLITAAHWERELSLLLGDDLYAFCESLRRARAEHDQILAFSTSVPRNEALTGSQLQELLVAKLKYKDARAALELRAELDAQLPPMERDYANDITEQALIRHRIEYMDAARTALTEQQWLLLQDFEMQSEARSERNDRTSSGSLRQFPD